MTRARRLRGDRARCPRQRHLPGARPQRPQVVGLERFGLGHSWGASHDTSRILRHSYHTPAYVRLTQEAYADWARLERDAGTSLVSGVGGLDLFPPEPAISPVDYTESLDGSASTTTCSTPPSVMSRWPQFRLPDGLIALHQADAAIVPAARGTRVMQDQARRHGADLRELTPVLGVRDLAIARRRGGDHARRPALRRARGLRRRVGQRGPRGPRAPHPARGDPGAGDLLRAAGPDGFAQGRCRCGSGWTTRRTTVSRRTASRRSRRPRTAGARRRPRTARVGGRRGHAVRARRAHAADPAGQRCAGALAALPVHPDAGPRLRDLGRCRATSRSSSGMGAAHGFKFAPTFGRLLADLAVEGSTTTDLTRFRMDRPALTDPDYQAHWLV